MLERTVVLIASLLFCTAVARVGDAAGAQIHKGTVLSASADRMVMKDTGGKEQSFSVDAAAKITVNGKPGKLEDFQETMPVQVTTDEKGRVLAVSTIDKHKRSQPVALSSR